MKSDFKKGLGFIGLSILAYSSMPILIRTLDKGNIPPFSQVSLRYVFAFLAALTYFMIRKAKFKIKKNLIILLVLISIFGYGFSTVLYTFANLNTEISNAVFIFFTFTIMTPVMAYLWLKEKINKYNLIGLVVAFLGIGFLIRPNSFVTWKLGGLFALAASLLQAIYLVGRRKLKNVSSELIMLSSTFLGMVSVGTLAFIFEREFFVNGGILSLSSSTKWLTVIFGLLNFWGWYFLNRAFQILTAAVGSLLFLWEPIIIVVLAFMFYGEIPSIYAGVGAGLVLASSLMVLIKGKN